MADRLVVDLYPDGTAAVSAQLDGDDLADGGPPFELAWPLDDRALDDLCFYLEDYLRLPAGVYQDRGAEIQDCLPRWGAAVFDAIFGGGQARDAYQRLRARPDGTRLVFRSADPRLLALPWELMRDPARPTPLALDLAGVSRGLPVRQLAETVPVPGGKLRVLMVIARPYGQADVGYQMIARPLLDRLRAVRGGVDLVVLRPPTLDQLALTLRRASVEGAPFHVVHFDGHGLQNDKGFPASEPRDVYQGRPGEGVLVFEKPDGGADEVPASAVAQVLTDAKVPVVVLNACRSGAIGKELEAAVATRLLQEGTASVVAMAYTVYAVAAAEFMAAFYEALFAGQPVSAAVTAGRKRMARNNDRPSRKGDLPLDDWVVPVHYVRRDVSFPQVARPRADSRSLDAVLDQINETTRGQETGELDPVGTFTGRDWLTCQLETAARVHRVVVLHGPGGTGKTELAKAFGRWWRDTSGTERPEWVFFHSFEPGVATFGLDGVVNQIGRAVFSSRFDQLEPADRRAAVERVLAEHRMLLIWDNFETVHSMPEGDGGEDLRDFLTRLAASGQSAVLITSRSPEPWLGDLRRVTVGGLTPLEANEYASTLLADLAAARAWRRKPAFGELMEWLDGHPLSMRLILPHLETTEPAALLSALRGSGSLPDAGDGRLTSLPTSIAYSYAHLSDQAKRLLPALSLFQGYADVAALVLFSGQSGIPERFAGATDQDWLTSLRDAAAVGLLTAAGGAFFRIHPALPSYLAARWRDEDPAGYAAGRASATAALATACAWLGSWLEDQISSGEAGQALAVVGMHRRTFGSMLRYTLAHALWQEAHAIIRALDSYLASRGLEEEADCWADQVRLATENPDGSPREANGPLGELWRFTVTEQAGRQTERRELDRAERNEKQVLAALLGLPSSPDQRRELSTAYLNLGGIAYERQRLDEAEDWARKALLIDEELGDQCGVSYSSELLGGIAQELGRLDEAEARYSQALALRRELGDKPGQALTLLRLGGLAQERGDLQAAEAWCRMALAIQEELGHKRGRATVYHNLGMLAVAQGLPEQAERLYQESLALAEELGDRAGQAITYHQLGILEQGRGHLIDAESWYQKALAIFREVGDRVGIAFALGQLGLLAAEQGDPRLALERFVECVTQFDEFRSPPARSAPEQIARLTRELGMGTLEEAWRKVTGGEVPREVRDYVEAGEDDG